MTKEDMIALGIPKEKMKDFRTRYFQDVKKAAQRMNKTAEQSNDDLRKAVASLIRVIDNPATLQKILVFASSVYTEDCQCQ